MVRKKSHQSVVFRRTFSVEHRDQNSTIITFQEWWGLIDLHESRVHNSANPEAQAAMMQMGPMCPDMSHPSQLPSVVKGPKDLTGLRGWTLFLAPYTLAFQGMDGIRQHMQQTQQTGRMCYVQIIVVAGMIIWWSRSKGKNTGERWKVVGRIETHRNSYDYIFITNVCHTSSSNREVSDKWVLTGR